MSDLFHSLTDPIPQVRPDLQRYTVDNAGRSLLIFHDMRGYVPEGFALYSDVEPLLSLINGRHSVEDIALFTEGAVSQEELLTFIRSLDEHLILGSPYFRHRSEVIEREYESSKTHHPVTAGSSYPADPAGLKIYLDEAFSKVSISLTGKKVTALYAPHIDLRVGLDTYAEAFSNIRHLKPEKVIVLATSHYSGLYPRQYRETPFIVSNKTFPMPNGDIRTDEQMYTQVQAFMESKGELSGVSLQDRAHRIEHSIELHLLFLNHIWQHDFSILPVLVGSLDELFYSDNSFREQQLETFASFLRELADEHTLFLISGDLSHTGHKFGDEKDARSMADEVRAHDERFLHTAEKANPSAMVSLMKENMDAYRICGFPPLLTYLKVGTANNGTTINYDRWDEQERNSAVTFGSILY